MIKIEHPCKIWQKDINLIFEGMALECPHKITVNCSHSTITELEDDSKNAYPDKQ